MAGLPQAVRDHLAAVGLASVEQVADSVAPSHVKGADGNYITITVDVVFLEAMREACPDIVKPATGAWAAVRKF